MRESAIVRAIAAVLVLVLAVALTLAACGESDEEQAQSRVCDARADIRQQVEKLQGLTLSTASVEAVQQSIGAIGDDLAAIKDAEADLSGQRKQDAQNAVSAFQSQVSDIAGDLVAGLTGGQQAQAQLESALQQLASGFREAFAPVDC